MIREDLAMTADELSAPLGQNKKFRRRFELVLSMPQLLLGTLGLCVVAAGAWAVLEHSWSGGRPATPVPVNVAAPETGKKTEYPNLAARPEGIPSPPIQLESGPSEPVRSVTAPGKTITIIDGSSGKRQEIVIPETPEKDTDLSEPAEIPRMPRNAARPLPRPQR
jgi:uncharacterized protein